MADHNTILPHNHHNNEEHLADFKSGESTIEAVSEALKQLGDPSRLRIFWYLCHSEDCVADIAAAVGMSSPAVSHHLRLLKTTGLVQSHREGKEMLYKIADSELAGSLHLTIDNLAKITCPNKK